MSKAERFARFAAEAKQADAVEVVILEGWLDDEIRCESKHAITGKAACSIEVTHVVTLRCERDYRVCAVSAAAERRRILEGKPHNKCGVPYADCITVRPI